MIDIHTIIEYLETYPTESRLLELKEFLQSKPELWKKYKYKIISETYKELLNDLKEIKRD